MNLIINTHGSLLPEYFIIPRGITVKFASIPGSVLCTPLHYTQHIDKKSYTDIKTIKRIRYPYIRHSGEFCENVVFTDLSQLKETGYDRTFFDIELSNESGKRIKLVEMNPNNFNLRDLLVNYQNRKMTVYIQTCLGCIPEIQYYKCFPHFKVNCKKEESYAVPIFTTTIKNKQVYYFNIHGQLSIICSESLDSLETYTRTVYNKRYYLPEDTKTYNVRSLHANSVTQKPIFVKTIYVIPEKPPKRIPTKPIVDYIRGFNPTIDTNYVIFKDYELCLLFVLASKDSNAIYNYFVEFERNHRGLRNQNRFYYNQHVCDAMMRYHDYITQNQYVLPLNLRVTDKTTWLGMDIGNV